jgi:hypothetical protein
LARRRETLFSGGEDTHTAVLHQEGEAAMRADFTNAPTLDALLILFVSYEPSEVLTFYRAIEQFSADVPHLAGTLQTDLPPALCPIPSRKSRYWRRKGVVIWPIRVTPRPRSSLRTEGDFE